MMDKPEWGKWGWNETNRYWVRTAFGMYLRLDEKRSDGGGWQWYAVATLVRPNAAGLKDKVLGKGFCGSVRGAKYAATACANRFAERFARPPQKEER